MSPTIFKRHKEELLKYDPEYPEMVAGIRSEEYYVNMMIAWFFSTALAKQYESRRITDEQKKYLKSLKVTY